MSVRQLKNLLFKSAQLQQQIEKEQRKFAPDRYRLIKLRELRLIVSEKLHRLFAQPEKPVPVPAKAGRRSGRSSYHGRPAWDC